MKRFKVRFIGVSPILMNPATEDLLDQLEGGAGARKPPDTTLSSEEKAAKKVIRNGGDEVGIPQEYLFGCLVEAGRQVKKDGKRAISTKESTLLPSFLSIEEMFFPFEDQKEQWVVDRRKGNLINAGKKVAVTITRPRFNKWSFCVTLIIDEKEIAVEKVKDLLQKAGSSVGLGDFRPARRGPFGRFETAEWAEIK